MNRISDKGLKFLMKQEGVHFQVMDSRTGRIISKFSQAKGYPVIGVGHRISNNEKQFYAKYLNGKRKLSKYQVKELLRSDLIGFENTLNSFIGDAPLTQSMWDALVSLAFNTGSNSSSVKKAISSIIAKDYKGAANEIWNGPVKSQGRVQAKLVKRRKDEAKLFMKDGIPGDGSKNNSRLTGFGALLGLTAFVGSRYLRSNGVETKLDSSSLERIKKELKNE